MHYLWSLVVKYKFNDNGPIGTRIEIHINNDKVKLKGSAKKLSSRKQQDGSNDYLPGNLDELNHTNKVEQEKQKAISPPYQKNYRILGQ